MQRANWHGFSLRGNLEVFLKSGLSIISSDLINSHFCGAMDFCIWNFKSDQHSNFNLYFIKMIYVQIKYIVEQCYRNS